jgi:hypothetical protein
VKLTSVEFLVTSTVVYWELIGVISGAELPELDVEIRVALE